MLQETAIPWSIHPPHEALSFMAALRAQREHPTTLRHYFDIIPFLNRWRDGLENLHPRMKIMCEPLAPCGSRPNCVCGRADAQARHRVEPFAVSGDAAAAFSRLKNLVAGMPRTAIVTATDDYLHAVCRTPLGFADDLECRLCRAHSMIHIRSAPRLGYYDFGVNRARVEALRRQLQAE